MHLPDRARQRQVIQACRPAMFFRDDVIHLAAEIGVALVDQAVFTSAAGALLNRPSQLGADIATHERAVLGPALSLFA